MSDTFNPIPPTQWGVIHETIKRIWEAMNARQPMPPTFPEEVVNALDDNLKIVYFDLLALYDIAEKIDILVNRPNLKGWFVTVADLLAHPGPFNHGDFAYVSEIRPPLGHGTVWSWSAANGWRDTGEMIPNRAAPPGERMPLADGETGQAGTRIDYAREDHRHPHGEAVLGLFARIAEIAVEIAGRYKKPPAGIPLVDMDPEARRLILTGPATVTRVWGISGHVATLEGTNQNAHLWALHDFLLIDSHDRNVVGLALPAFHLFQIREINREADTLALNPMGNFRGPKGGLGEPEDVEIPIASPAVRGGIRFEAGNGLELEDGDRLCLRLATADKAGAMSGGDRRFLGEMPANLISAEPGNMLGIGEDGGLRVPPAAQGVIPRYIGDWIWDRVYNPGDVVRFFNRLFIAHARISDGSLPGNTLPWRWLTHADFASVGPGLDISMFSTNNYRWEPMSLINPFVPPGQSFDQTNPCERGTSAVRDMFVTFSRNFAGNDRRVNVTGAGALVPAGTPAHDNSGLRNGVLEVTGSLTNIFTVTTPGQPWPGVFGGLSPSTVRRIA